MPPILLLISVRGALGHLLAGSKLGRVALSLTPVDIPLTQRMTADSSGVCCPTSKQTAASPGPSQAWVRALALAGMLAALASGVGCGGEGGSKFVPDTPSPSPDATSTTVQGEERLARACAKLFISDPGVASADWGPRTPPRYTTNPANWHTGIDCAALSDLAIASDPAYKEPIDPSGKSAAEINQLLRAKPSAAIATPVHGWVMFANGRGAAVADAGYGCPDILDAEALKLKGNPLVIHEFHSRRTFLMLHARYHAVRAGSTVALGDLVGYEGSVGKSSGVHLHFEARAGQQCNGAAAYTDSIDPVAALLADF